MAASNQRSTQKTEVPPAVIALAIAGLLAFAAFVGYRTLGPQAPEKPNLPPLTAQQQANNDFIKKLAMQTGGDISKASPEDEKRLQDITRGMGAMALQGSYKAQTGK
jgi:hypothetical protein